MSETASVASTATVTVSPDVRAYVDMYYALRGEEDVRSQEQLLTESMWKLRGVVESRKQLLTRHTQALDGARAQHERLRSSLLHRMTRAQHIRVTAEGVARAESRVRDTAQALSAAQAEQSALEKQRTELARAAAAHAMEQTRLDMLGDALCAPGSSAAAATAPCMTELETLRLLCKLIPTEMVREKRTRAALVKAESNGRACLKILRDVLNMSIQLGMANDNRDRLFPGQPSTLTKRSMPYFLRAKVCLGDFYTNVSNARMRQALVERAPIMDLADLTRLPGKKNKPLDADGMQKSIETSYTQCQHVCTYAQHEIRISHAREAALRTFQTETEEQIRAAEERVRQARAYALEGDEGKLALLIEALPDEHDGPRPPPLAALGLDEDEERESLSDTASVACTLASTATAVSIVGSSPAVYARAWTRLHRRVVDINDACRTDHDDEDLPWTPGALGF